jgi:hypothetical protein
MANAKRQTLVYRGGTPELKKAPYTGGTAKVEKLPLAKPKASTTGRFSGGGASRGGVSRDSGKMLMKKTRKPISAKSESTATNGKMMMTKIRKKKETQ